MYDAIMWQGQCHAQSGVSCGEPSPQHVFEGFQSRMCPSFYIAAACRESNIFTIRMGLESNAMQARIVEVFCQTR